jgi:hypothetical protein
MRNKTERNDVRWIAPILRSGWFREVHFKSPESHYIRTILSSAERCCANASTWLMKSVAC